MSELIDRLLKAEVPNVQKTLPTKEFEIPRLREVLGGPARVTLRGLPYGKVQELREMTRDADIHILLAGCQELAELAGDSRIQSRMDAATPVDAVKGLLLPGEIDDLSLEVERLCGYRRRTIDEVKNG